MINQTGIVINALMVLKTNSDDASSSSPEAALDINKTDNTVGAAVWRTKSFRVILGNFIIVEIMNIKTGKTISLMNKVSLIDKILALIVERLDFLIKLRRFPTMQ